MSRPPKPSALQSAVSGLFKLGRRDPVPTLIREIDRTEARMFRVFREGLGCRDRDVRSMEISYFATAIAVTLYQQKSKAANKREVVGQVVRMVLEDSLEAFETEMSLGQAMAEYQKRQSEHANLLQVLIDPNQRMSQSPAVSMLYHLYACVTAQSPREHLSEIETAAELVAGLVREQVTLIEKRL